MKKDLEEMYDVKKGSNSNLSESVIDECYANLAASFDREDGGFGESPKFPTPSNLFFLMRYSTNKQSEMALSMVTKTIDSMLAGGIYDQVGGGFHRYSTDRYWLVPHFEKMLYDNALLTQVYCEAYLITRKEEYARIVKETLSWALREMKSPEGGFYSSEDADSAEGEGTYYLWNLEGSEARLSVQTEVQGKTSFQDAFRSQGRGTLKEKKQSSLSNLVRPSHKSSA